MPDSYKIPLKIASIYAAVSGIWILFSDKLLASLFSNQELVIRLSILKGWLFVTITAVILFWLIRNYVIASLNKNQMMREVVQGVSAATGEEFFASLVKHLALLLKADYALVGELTGASPPTVRTISVYGKGALMENFVYDLTGSPCEEAIGRLSGCFYPDGVSLKFPEDLLLKEMGIEGYIGTPLRDSSGHTLGIMVALSCHPMKEIGLAETLFSLFAVRAVAELERRKAEADLRESEEHYRYLFETNPQPMWVYDTDTLVFLMVNKSAVRLYGYSREEFLAMSIRDIRPQEDVPALMTHLGAGKDEFDNAGIWRHRKKDGTVIDVEITSHAVLFEGKSARLVLAHDVTLQVKAEKALQNQFSQLTTIFDSINAVVYVADLDTYEILYLNRYGTTSFGRDWHGKTCFEVFQTSQDGPCPFCTNELLVVDGKPCPPYVWEYQNTVNGNWYQCIDRAIPWTDGRLVRLEIAFDISDRKGMERMKDELVSAVSHEMRTPLTAMLGYTEFILENQVSPEQQKEFIQTIHHETERLNELISNFLDLQRLKSRPELPEVVHLSVKTLFEETYKLFGATQHGHRILIDCPPNLPQVIGNSDQMHQVLLNLVSNAMKYSPERTTITIGADSGTDSVVLWVKDEGIGIPADMQERIFERFYRLDNSDRRLVGGAGLGLALVREIVAAHHGRVWVESNPGGGSTFKVQLPAVPEVQPL